MFVQPRTFNFLHTSSRTFNSFGKLHFTSISRAQSCVPAITSQKRFYNSSNRQHWSYPSSTSAEGSFHGTGISQFQHITKEDPGVVQHKKSIQSSGKKLSQLLSIYADITPISVYNRVPTISDNYSTLQSNETFETGEEIDKDQRYVLKWFALLPSVLFQLMEILHKVLKKNFVTQM